ncbi:ankyrin repeat protein [Acanthamoeba polyphaga moumouvirus]|uniref:Ankyrin repeat protein n=1 Tax=Acanthamoeba polyphaga moumouvirus TaxID=1269028 RepID=L7RGT1_9VIRU|nr:ankyrin repeat protein [Acanthamoeba polyphaga moumouvirus]AGC02340.1 ankyrin repeat protein [Acanthamoeba polyphaga moumouvirus]
MSCENVYEAITANDIKMIDHFINKDTDINGILFYACAIGKINVINHIVEQYRDKIDLNIVESKISKVKTFCNCENSFKHLSNLINANNAKYQVIDVPDTLDISHTPEISELIELREEINYGRSTANIFEAIEKDNMPDIDFYMSKCQNINDILFYVCTINKKYLINYIAKKFNPDIKSVYNKLIDSRSQLSCDDSIEYLGDIVMDHEFSVRPEIITVSEPIEIKDIDPFKVVDDQIELDPSGYILIGSNKRDHINMISKDISKTYNNIISYAVHFEIPSLLIACYLSVNDDCFDLIKELIKVGMNLNMNCSGLVPLGLALEGNNKKIVKLLIEKGANINATDENGNTILMQAYKYSKGEKYLDIVQLLLSKGADITIKNKSGKTFFDLVRENN